MNATLPPGSVASLLPDTASLSWWQLLVAPALLALVLLLPRGGQPPNPTPTSADPNPLPFHIFRAKTSHARYLPTLSKHVFSYPVLYFGFDLDALESGALELGRWFGYRPKGWALTGLRPGGYLGKSGGKDRTIRQKLDELMPREGVPVEDVGKVYSVTMPEYCGVEGINPLTIHYGYKVGQDKNKDRLELKVVVLEVHNTFGETHVYLLRTGVDEDDKVALGLDHQFTFPRAFHVSPFNDRSGFYRVAIVDPLKRNPHNPEINIRITFLTPQMDKKLFADLRGTATPLTRSTLLRALARWPLSLFLTLPRILWQAGRLHYAKRLDVFPRPEPYVRLEGDGEGEEVRGEGVEGEGEIVNPVEGGGKVGGLGWQAEGEGGRWARERVTAFVKRRVEEVWEKEGRRVRVVLQPADKAVEVVDIQPRAVQADATDATSDSAAPPAVELLRVFYLTPLFFADVVACPSAQLAYELGSLTERRWRVNNPALFLNLFGPPPTPVTYPLPTRLARRLRLHTLRWTLAFAPPAASAAASSDLPAPLSSPHAWPAHPLDDCKAGEWGMVSALWWNMVALKLSYWVFVLFRARFVRGMETWGEWARWAERKEGRREEEGVKAKVEYGSVRREV